jgi:protocatechuate 3,4-dioxygenase beta subunit
MSMQSAFPATFIFPAVIGLAFSAPQADTNKVSKPATATISGRVVDILGAPVAKARVNAELVPASRSYTCGTSADGKFTLPGLDAGRYRIVVERSGYLRKVFESRTATGDGTLVTLTPRQEMTDVVVHLTPEATITGRVLDEDRDPVANVPVRAFRYTHDLGLRRPRQFALGETDSTGAFRLTGIGAGRYYMVATPRQALMESAAVPSGEKVQYSYITTYYGGSAEASSAQPIAISPGESAAAGDLILRKAPIVHIRGKINAEAFSGELGRLEVHALPDDDQSDVQLFEAPSARVSKEGTFDLIASPGRYLLLVTAAVGRISILGRESLVVGETDVENVVVALVAGEVSGNLAYADPKSEVKNAVGPPFVVLLSEGPGTVSGPSQPVNQNSFLFRNLSPSRYQVRVTGLPPDVYLQSIRSDGGEDLMATDLDLTRGGRRTLTVTLSRSPASIDGSVVDDNGKPVPDIVVSAAPKPLDARQAHRYRRMVSDRNGHFTMPNFPPGEYCLYTWKELADGDEYDDELLQTEAARCTSASLQEKDTQTVQLTFQPPKSSVP